MGSLHALRLLRGGALARPEPVRPDGAARGTRGETVTLGEVVRVVIVTLLVIELAVAVGLAVT